MRKTVFALLFACLATVALAATLAEVTADANALHSEYQSLETRVDNCPDGTCQDAAQILADLASAESDRSQLHTDRATLDPCTTCSSVDGTIGDIDDLSADLASGTSEWNETP